MKRDKQVSGGQAGRARGSQPRPSAAIGLALACILLPAIRLVDWPSECEGLAVAQHRCFPGLPQGQSMSPAHLPELDGQELIAYCRQSRELLERSCR